MNNWRWHNPHAFGDQVDCANLQRTSLGMVLCAGMRFSLYGSDDFRAMVELPCGEWYKPDDFLAVRSLNWNEVIDKDDDEKNWADTGVPSSDWEREGK